MEHDKLVFCLVGIDFLDSELKPDCKETPFVNEYQTFLLSLLYIRFLNTLRFIELA